jgi:hypothetical protein
MQCFGGDGKASMRTSLIQLDFGDALLVDKGGVRALYLREGRDFHSWKVMH